MTRNSKLKNWDIEERMGRVRSGEKNLNLAPEGHLTENGRGEERATAEHKEALKGVWGEKKASFKNLRERFQGRIRDTPARGKKNLVLPTKEGYQ